jgi:hypothetical protein
MSLSGVLHRDLQVNNILVFEKEGKIQHLVYGPEGKKDEDPEFKIPIYFELKVCDFGVSAFEDD